MPKIEAVLRACVLIHENYSETLLMASKQTTNAANNETSGCAESVLERATGGLLKLGLESAETAGVHLLGLVVSIPMLAITARWLGPDGRGEFVTTTTWANLAATVCGLSLGMVAIHEMTRTAKRELRSLLGTLLVLALVLSASAWVAGFVLFRTDRSIFGEIRLGYLLLAFAGVPVLVSREYMGSLLIANSRVTTWNRAQASGTLLTFGIVGALALTDKLTVWGIILAWLIGQFAVFSISGAILYRSAGGMRIDIRKARALLSGGYKLHLNAIGGILISSIDVLLVNAFAGAHEVGCYQLAMKLVLNVTLIAQAVGVVSYSRVVTSGPDASWGLIRKICMITMGLITVGALLAAWIAPILISIIAGPEFSRSVPLFRMMLIAVPGLGLSALMASQWICRGFFWTAGLLTFLVAAVNALSNILLVPRYGVHGAVGSFVGVYVISIGANGWMFIYCEQRWRSVEQPKYLALTSATTAD